MIKKLDTERVGAMGKNRFGSTMEVIKYNSNIDIYVRFENNFIVHTNWQAFQNGKVENPYDKSVYGIGCIGVGRYKSFDGKNMTSQYKAWFAMIERCYGNSNRERYIECTVCEEWHNYQNFAEWYDNNFYKIEGERMELDKDILFKGNKLYSPETCVFVPRNINCLFTKSDKVRGTLPIGISCKDKTNKYRVRCNNGKKETIYLGLYNSLDKAFNIYKNYKEKIIKEIADEYKEHIPKKLYEAMYTYKVEITD